MSQLKLVISFLVSGFLVMNLLVGCASTTTIKSAPGAKIYVDGKYLGEESVVYTDKKTINSQTIVEIKKEGFRKQTATISRSGPINVGALVGGILLAPTLFGLAFFFWVVDYEKVYAFELEPDTAKK